MPKNSTIIVGHALGSHKKSIKRKNIGISPKIIDFYNKNKQNIKTIIFSGDVLKEPTLERWQMFFETFEDNIDIHIAPGNHDVGYENQFLRNIFELAISKNKSNISYPYFYIDDGSLIIIDDSNKKNFEVGKINNFISEFGQQNDIFIIRHHNLAKSLRWSANMKGSQEYLESKFFKERIINNGNKKITFIYGDGGSSYRLPRADCKKIGNTNHIINGIGDFENDLIIILVDKKLYFMNL